VTYNHSAAELKSFLSVQFLFYTLVGSPYILTDCNAPVVNIENRMNLKIVVFRWKK